MEGPPRLGVTDHTSPSAGTVVGGAYRAVQGRDTLGVNDFRPRTGTVPPDPILYCVVVVDTVAVFPPVTVVTVVPVVVVTTRYSRGAGRPPPGRIQSGRTATDDDIPNGPTTVRTTKTYPRRGTNGNRGNPGPWSQPTFSTQPRPRVPG